MSKDVLFLFYEDAPYAWGMREFLDAYYHKSGEPIQGRCGYLRQSFPLIMEDFNFNKISLFMDGVNSQLSDIDLYSEV